MIATLPMYDLPGLEAATDAWWAGLSRHFRAQGLEEVPDNLTRDEARREQNWLSPTLFLSQTCGYPLVHALAGKVRLVATPRQRAPGSSGALNRSLIIARSGASETRLSDFKNATVAINAYDSQSGCNALRLMTEPLGGWEALFAETKISGSHAESIALVRDGVADTAAIDCVTFALIGDSNPNHLSGLHVIDQSAATPALPFITNADINDEDLARLRTALYAAVVDVDLIEVRHSLRIEGIEEIPLADYESAMLRR